MPRKIIIPNLDDLLRRYLAGESENQLAKEAGVNRCTFRRRLLDAGITPRSRSDAETLKWEQMSIEQRRSQVKAAHDVTRGRKVTTEELSMRAKTREGNLAYNIGEYEFILADWLREIGIGFIQNFAIGPYNCDFGIGSITVEVWGGGWHPKTEDTKRTKHILDAGYSMLFVDLDRRRFPINRIVTEYVIALLQETSSDPAARCQYWMVRGDGELIFKRFNDDNISLIPPFTTGRDISNGQYKRIPR